MAAGALLGSYKRRKEERHHKKTQTRTSRVFLFQNAAEGLISALEKSEEYFDDDMSLEAIKGLAEDYTSSLYHMMTVRVTLNCDKKQTKL